MTSASVRAKSTWNADEALPVDRRGESSCGDHLLAAGQEPFADAHEDRAEQRLLVGEVAVHRRAAHADGGAELFEAHAAEAALGEQTRRLVQDRGLAIRLGAVALGDAACHFS